MDEWTAGGGVAAVLLTALLAYLRRRRKGPGGRLRARFHISFRSPPSSASSETPESEPPPFPGESDRPTRPPERPHRRRKD